MIKTGQKLWNLGKVGFVRKKRKKWRNEGDRGDGMADGGVAVAR